MSNLTGCRALFSATSPPSPNRMPVLSTPQPPSQGPADFVEGGFPPARLLTQLLASALRVGLKLSKSSKTPEDEKSVG